MELQVAAQKEAPRWQREGSSARKLFRLIERSLHWHSPSSVQSPLVCPRVTQLAVHAHSPKVHLNPARAGEVKPRITRRRRDLLAAAIVEVLSHQVVSETRGGALS